MTLYLLPNILSEDSNEKYFLPSGLDEIIQSLDGLFAENAKNARKYLKRFISGDKIRSLDIKEVSKHTKKEELIEFVSLMKNKTFGLITDCGMSCLADPGSDLIYFARKKNIKIVPLSGPSSIFFAIMLSGLHSQRFSFHGYLPYKDEHLKSFLKKIEQSSLTEDSLQLWIETPYRSDKMLNIALESLHPSSYLCLAKNITALDELIFTKTVSEWRKSKIVIGKNPCVFLLKAKNKYF